MFHVNVEGAIFRDGKWLIIERSEKEGHAGGLLSLVGGTVEHVGHSISHLEQTLHREMFEEVGVKVSEKMIYVRNTTFTLEDGSEVLDIVFLCELMEGEPYCKSVDEVAAVYLMSIDEILQHPKSPPWLIDSIKEAESLLGSCKS